MQAFPAKGLRDKRAKDYDERRDPTKGRSRAESMRILRMCRRFADNLIYILTDVTKGQSVQWFDIQDAITDRDDEAIIDWRGVVENTRKDGYQTNSDGLLTAMHDDSLRATNCIEAVTTYIDGHGSTSQHYMLRKTVYSPFSCLHWGRLPLTLQCWSEIAAPLIWSRAIWQWEHALNLYAERNGIKLHDQFEFSTLVGWNMVTAKRAPLISEQAELWTGPIIYMLSAHTSLRPSNKHGAQE